MNTRGEILSRLKEARAALKYADGSMRPMLDERVKIHELALAKYNRSCETTDEAPPSAAECYKGLDETPAPSPVAKLKRRTTYTEVEEHFPPATPEDDDDEKDENDDDDDDEKEKDIDAKMSAALKLQGQSTQAIRQLAVSLGMSSPMLVPSAKAIMATRGESGELTYNAATGRMENAK